MKVVNVHSDFILTPLFEILSDGLAGLNALGEGVEIVPLLDYYMPSLFLKMTGALEQKMKCICWDMASNDYDYRNTFLRDKLRIYGECSTYDSKLGIYGDLITVISRCNPGFVVEEIWDEIEITDEIFSKVRKEWEEGDVNPIVTKVIANAGAISDEQKTFIRQRILENPKHAKVLEKMLRDAKKIHYFKEESKRFKIMMKMSSLVATFPKDYEGFLSKANAWSDMSLFATADKLFPEHLSEMYIEEVYKHRNRCAHNLTSYQSNLPSLDVLANQKDGDDNYFVRFWLIILMDEIFMRLYKYYMEHAEYV